MGKKRKLNRFISKWLKSDLPEDRSSTVLLLGVTRIPTSPAPARRPCSLPLGPINPPQLSRKSSISFRRSFVRRNSSSLSRRRHQEQRSVSSSEDDSKGCSNNEEVITPINVVSSGDSLTSSVSIYVSHDNSNTDSGPVMDRSVDSIGTCSLDVEASADLSDWSEVSSVGTLRSASIVTPSPEPHLPSYLSLACTVNGYSTTTNYDPVRLSKSRDASPHRPGDDHLTPKHIPTYSVQNNLLSPPNLVPLPLCTQSKKRNKMAENALTHQHHHQEFYNSSKTMTFMNETHYSRKIFNSNDTVDACFENGHHNIQSKCVSYESRNILSAVNGQTNKCSSESIIKQEWKNNKGSKSFIQQRVERLYGPGALAQGFFVTTRQRNRTSESECDQNKSNNAKQENEKHSKSMSDKLLDDFSESSMKQSTSSPSLPVMRHLRPEFRAQLPTISTRKSKESSMQKSSTVPTLKNEVKVNGHSEAEKTIVVPVPEINAIDKKAMIVTGDKDGHYFLEILEGEAKRLLKLADQADTELNTEGLSDEVVGKLRSAAGKARLLVTQKMQQFKGLCTNNITQVDGEAFPTTNEDLQGFWDMVMLQVDQVDNLFKEINTLKANNWKEVIEDKVDSKTSVNSSSNKKRVVNRAKPAVSAASEEARKQREAQRKQMIEERRKAMRAQNKPNESIEIFVPESS